MEKIKAFCEQRVNGNFNVINIPAATLDKLLGKFFKDIRQQNGGEYESDRISSFQKSIQRHLKELKLPFNILQDEEFRRSREVLAARRKNLVKQGRENMPNACLELTTEAVEERRIWLPQPRSTSAHIVVVRFPSLWFPGKG